MAPHPCLLPVQEAYAEYLRSIQYISQVLLEQVDCSKGMEGSSPPRPA